MRPMTATFSKIRTLTDRAFADGLSAFEGAVLGAAALLLSIGVGFGVGDMMAERAEQAEIEFDLRALVAEAGFDAAVCPNGWAADHAPIVGLTEAEVTAWYLRESVSLTDGDVKRDVATWLRAPADFRQTRGAALTRTQILLCVAESRQII
ncbi:hypothetical protein JQC91_16090 [Jannaschia sp. Os4]|uniref:hypothetical protein n=1 Tax=Jannaschia sp. Os4 TaxID=2807617 RepID=UPI00193A27FD|nr:hypothetical protein [Jannaschia sp. Os4]MBM2577828.1 hypothetical protein [Jannaschia sp. Os4]